VTVNLVVPEPGKSLVDAYDRWRDIADSSACCDFAFHVAVTSWTDKVAQEMESLTKEKGMSSSSRSHRSSRRSRSRSSSNSSTSCSIG